MADMSFVNYRLLSASYYIVRIMATDQYKIILLNDYEPEFLTPRKYICTSTYTYTVTLHTTNTSCIKSKTYTCINAFTTSNISKSIYFL